MFHFWCLVLVLALDNDCVGMCVCYWKKNEQQTAEFKFIGRGGRWGRKLFQIFVAIKIKLKIEISNKLWKKNFE